MEDETKRLIQELMVVATKEDRGDDKVIVIPFDAWARIVINPFLQAGWKKETSGNNKV